MGGKSGWGSKSSWGSQNKGCGPRNNNEPSIPSEAKLVGTVTDGKGLVINVYATQVGNDVVFNIKVMSGKADLRGFFLDTDNNQANDSVVRVGGNDNTMSGTGQKFDKGFEIGTAGRSKDDISHTQITLKNVSLDSLDGLDFGIRATSVGNNRCDSVKLLGEFDLPDAPPPPPPPVLGNFPDFKALCGDVQQITLYFSGGPRDANGDGLFTVNLYNLDPGMDDDLDGPLASLLSTLRLADPGIPADSALLGVAIRGAVCHNYYAMDGDPDVDAVPGGVLVQGAAVDVAYDYLNLFAG